MNHSNHDPSRRELLGLAVGAGVVTVAGLARPAPARAGADGISRLIAVTQQKVEQASAEAAALEAADKQRPPLGAPREAAAQISAADSRRLRGQAALNAHLREIADNLARMQESSAVC